MEGCEDKQNDHSQKSLITCSVFLMFLAGCQLDIQVSELQEHFYVFIMCNDRGELASVFFLSHENGYLEGDLSTVEVFTHKAALPKFSLVTEDY